MHFSDYLIASVILGFSFYILYRYFWKKKGSCHGCSCQGGNCSGKPAPGSKLPSAP
ncbi:MAG TPA: FeoB-associated Cys-rich membrane protein [Geomonas sp.]|nr:FeoB-associated Cys-rich membrane protein [Geomonas sp.]